MLEKSPAPGQLSPVIMPAAGNDEPGTSGSTDREVKGGSDDKSVVSQATNEDCMTLV